MRSKAPLVLMEQIIMVLIFALAAALCLQTFVLSGSMSKRTEEKTRAGLEAQNAAETLKSGGIAGYMEEYGAVQKGDSYVSFFDEAWNVVFEEGEAAYCLEINRLETGNPYLWKADIRVRTGNGEELISISTAGQSEVRQNE